MPQPAWAARPRPRRSRPALKADFGAPARASEIDADELIDSCHGVATELDGFRGAAALARDALRELILRFALLLREVPEMVEADLNPVRCTTQGCLVLDMRVRIERRRSIKPVKTW